MNSATATEGERKAYYEGARTCFFSCMAGMIIGHLAGWWFFG